MKDVADDSGASGTDRLEFLTRENRSRPKQVADHSDQDAGDDGGPRRCGRIYSMYGYKNCRFCKCTGTVESRFSKQANEVPFTSFAEFCRN